MPRKNTPPKPPEPDKLVTEIQAAARLGVSPRTVRRYITEGRLPVWRIGPRRIRICIDDIDALYRFEAS